MTCAKTYQPFSLLEFLLVTGILFHNMAVFHQNWAEIDGLVTVEDLGCGGLCFRAPHSPTMSEAMSGREVAGWGAGGVLEEGNGRYSAVQVILEVKTQAVYGSRVCHF